jgi:hypothetical protein
VIHRDALYTRAPSGKLVGAVFACFVAVIFALSGFLTSGSEALKPGSEEPGQISHVEISGNFCEWGSEIVPTDATSVQPIRIERGEATHRLLNSLPV